jgi:hypothetical protein
MANYTTNTSDKKKRTVLLFWLVGALGLFGLEYFYVCKFKKGIIRLLIGLFALIAMVAMKGEEMFIPVSLLFWAILALPNLFKILFGAFRDNVGQPIRE